MRRLRSSSSTPSAVAGEGASTSASTSRKRRRGNEGKTATTDEENDKQQQNKLKRGLPDELWEKILGSVDDDSVTAFACVSKQLRRVQQRSGRRLETGLRHYSYGNEGAPDKLSAVSENWCLWCVRCLSVTRHEKWKQSWLFANAAAFWGHLDALKHWKEERRAKKSLFDEQTCAFAGLGGCLDVLKWLRKNKCPWNKTTCYYAATGGHLEVLKYAHENHCPWCEYTCAQAAEGGHLEVLKYLQENGCPWDDRTCKAAAEGGHLEVLKYLIENRCPTSWNIFEVAGRCNNDWISWKMLDCLAEGITNRTLNI